MRRVLGQPPAVTPDLRILDIATNHIRRFGLERMTITRVAEEAAMSHANVYRFYPSKNALIDEITAHWLRPLEAGLRVIADAPDPALDKVERIIFAIHRAYRDKLDNDAGVFDLFVAAVERKSEAARRHRARCELEIQRALEEGLGGAVFEPGDPRRAVTFVFDALHRFIDPIAVRMDAEISRSAVDERAARLTRFVLQALKRKLY